MTSTTQFVFLLAVFSTTSVILAKPLTALADEPTKPNVLLICVDDLRPELNCFGKDYIHSPNIDALADRGRAFHRHYVQAPTCGASRYALLTGRYGSGQNPALFNRAEKVKAGKKIPPSMPQLFRENGYTTVSVGKVSHHPGGHGGPDWNDTDQVELPAAWDRSPLPTGLWKTPRGVMHGLANGQVRSSEPKTMPVFESAEGDDSIYPDGMITEQAIAEMKQLAADPNKPFFLAVGIIRPHLPFGAPAKYMKHYRDTKLPAIDHPTRPAGKTTWHNSSEFRGYQSWSRDPNTDAEFATEVRKHYCACVSYADAMVGKIVKQLDDLGLTENTIIVLWGDHGWHLGEHGVWGKHTLFEESLHSPLIICQPGMPSPGQKTNAMVETIDLFPTLCELTGLPAPKKIHGVSLKPILDSPAATGHDAFSYQGRASTLRTPTQRFILHRSGETELYAHQADNTDEFVNLSIDQPELVAELTERLEKRMKMRRPHKRKKKPPSDPAKINPPKENQQSTSKEPDVMDEATNP